MKVTSSVMQPSRKRKKSKSRIGPIVTPRPGAAQLVSLSIGQLLLRVLSALRITVTRPLPLTVFGPHLRPLLTTDWH